MTDQRALFTDLDGTLYNWVDYFAPGFRAMVNEISQTTLLDNDKIIESFKRVYSLHGTIEYTYSVQELDIWQELGWSQEDVSKKIVGKARLAFEREAKKNLHLFESVRETLSWIKGQNFMVFGYTNAPRTHARKRIKSLGIESYFDHIVYFKDVIEQQQRKPIKIHKNLDKTEHEKLSISNYQLEFNFNIKIPKSKVSTKKSKQYKINEVPFQPSQQKPDPRPILFLMEQYNLDPELTFMIGDSLEYDILSAQKASVIDIWARYGRASKPVNIETIKSISTITSEEIIKNEQVRLKIRPTYIIDNFSELRAVLNNYIPNQWSFYM